MRLKRLFALISLSWFLIRIWGEKSAFQLITGPGNSQGLALWWTCHLFLMHPFVTLPLNSKQVSSLQISIVLCLSKALVPSFTWLNPSHPVYHYLHATFSGKSSLIITAGFSILCWWPPVFSLSQHLERHNHLFTYPCSQKDLWFQRAGPHSIALILCLLAESVY